MSSEPEPKGEEKSADPSAAFFRCDGTRGKEFPRSALPYKFGASNALTAADLRHLGTGHERFALQSSERLSSMLRMEWATKVHPLKTQSFEEFTQGLKEPSHLILFQVERRRGIGILEMDVPLAQAVADRLLGGKGKPGQEAEQLTEIELQLVEDAARVVLTSWASQILADESSPELRFIGTENSGRFLQTSTRDTVMFTVAMEVLFGESVHHVQIGVPISMIETAVKKLRQPKARPSETRQLELKEIHEGILIELTAQWKLPEKSISEIAMFAPGQLLTMPLEILDSTQVCVDGEPRFLGTVGIENTKVAVRITRELL